jgi:hypothetical protein
LVDILLLNETKLDEFIPNKLFEHAFNDVERRDRGSDGGGIMCFIKKAYSVRARHSTKFEFILPV